MPSSWTEVIKITSCTSRLLKNKSPSRSLLHYTVKEYLKLVSHVGTIAHKTATQMLTTSWAVSWTFLAHQPLAFHDHLYFWMSFDYSSANVRQKIINHKCIHYKQAPINCNTNINCASLSDKESLKAQLLATFCSILDVSSPTLSKWVITTDNHLQAAIKSFKLIPMTCLKTGTKLYLFFPTSQIIISVCSISPIIYFSKSLLFTTYRQLEVYCKCLGCNKDPAWSWDRNTDTSGKFFSIA